MEAEQQLIREWTYWEYDCWNKAIASIVRQSFPEQGDILNADFQKVYDVFYQIRGKYVLWQDVLRQKKQFTWRKQMISISRSVCKDWLGFPDRQVKEKGELEKKMLNIENGLIYVDSQNGVFVLEGNHRLSRWLLENSRGEKTDVHSWVLELPHAFHLSAAIEPFSVLFD